MSRVRRWVRSVYGRVLPRGLGDVVWQVLLFGSAYWAYRLLRGAVDDTQGATLAFQNARHIIDLEQATGLFDERSIQQATGGWPWTRAVASVIYLNAQSTVVLASVVFLYLRHNARYYFVRNMMITAMLIALITYVAFPTAPPRFFMPEYGFRDLVAEFTGVDHNDVRVDALVNPYAAIPSMHVCFAAIIGATMAKLCRRRTFRVLWLAYPVLMTWVVIVSGNHWILDALLGVVTAAASLAVARLLARVRPGAWSFTRSSGELASA